jgi:tripartite-type tricarboxylate transporter receptor subunit TctC
MKRKIEKFLIIGLLVVWIFSVHSINLAESKDPDYPTKSISLNLPFAAGGTTGAVVRPLTEAAGKSLGQQFVIVHKPGGGGILCAVTVMNATPDGYTLATVGAGMVFVAPFSEDSPYKDLSGLSMIMNFAGYNYPVMVRGDSPWQTWKEFIEWARRNPKAAKVGITGGKMVTSQGLVFGQIEMREQVEFTYIPLKGSAEVLSSILGGHTNLFGSTIDPGTMQYVKEGKLRILTYLAKEKIQGYENIPSTQDLYGFSLPNILGIVGPKGLPNYILKKLEDAFTKAVKDPDFVNIMERMYMPVLYMDSIQMKKYVDETLPKVGSIMKILKAEEAKRK